MTRVDQDTKNFMDAVADGPRPPEKQLEVALRTARSISKNPKKYVVRKLVSAALVGDEGSEKIAAAVAAVDVVAIFHTMTERYGRDWHDWEPETLWSTLKDLRGEESSRGLKEILMALQVVVSTNAPFEHWHIFENVANAFAGNPVDFGILQPIELTDAARTVRILLELRPKMIFDDEVWGYIAAIAKKSGVVYLPKDLFAGSTKPQEILDDLNNDLELGQQVRGRWPSPPRSDDDLGLKVQLLRLKEISDCVLSS